MTLLDDYEAKYKLWGVRIVLEMLKHVPNDLLRRTGVDGLLRSVSPSSISLHTSSYRWLVVENMFSAPPESRNRAPATRCHLCVARIGDDDHSVWIGAAI
jgi:uncharacterized protein YfaT (DUF1175 family)